MISSGRRLLPRHTAPNLNVLTDDWAATVAPVGNSVRSVFYDDRGAPYATEWQLCGPGERPSLAAVRGIALVTGIRPARAMLIDPTKKGVSAVTFTFRDRSV